jgi:lipopolysaccharide transport system ATP-binding protein
MREKDTLIKVEGLWKKYCRDLKTSLYYGLVDILHECLCFKNLNLQLRNREFWALQDINFELKRGETLGIVGPNGAGKTTLLKLLNGLIKPTRGSITVNGTMQGLIELGRAFKPMLSGRENILVSASVLGIKKKDLLPKLEELIEFAGLEDFIDSPVMTYSAGMKVRLGFSVALLIQPEILLLDEILAVGDIAFQMKSLDRVAQIREQAGGVIFVSHNLNQIRRLCTRCIILDRGKIVMYGGPNEVIDAYIKMQDFSEVRSRLKQSDVLIEGKGIELLNWEIEQKGHQGDRKIARGGFVLCYHIKLSRRYEKLEIDFVLFNEVMNQILNQSFRCKELENTTGEYIVSIELPDLSLSPRHYFPYFAVIDQQTLKKIIRFRDPTGFTVKGEASSVALLKPELRVSINKKI